MNVMFVRFFFGKCTSHVHKYAHIILPMKAPSISREQAVEGAIAVLDTAFFSALQEPARIAVLRRLMLLGRADIGQIAEGLPQERSVVSRHLQVLYDAGIVRSTKDGRHRYYEVDGPAVLRNLETITQRIKAISVFCCPAVEQTK